MRKPRVSPNPLTGRVFGRLTVLQELPERTPRGSRLWLCRCECGREHRAVGVYLTSGQTKSCGCLKAELQKQGCNLKHGYRWDPATRAEYYTWIAMRDRCNNPKNIGYPNYGGRGIVVSHEWDDFPTFLRDMGPRHSPKHSIERKDNDGPYAAWNCFWATRTEQGRNKRNNTKLVFRGEEKTLPEWAEIRGLKQACIYKRVFILGWTVEDALTLPLQDPRPRPGRARPGDL